MSIQQSVNQGISLASLLYTQSPMFKSGVEKRQLQIEANRRMKAEAAARTEAERTNYEESVAAYQYEQEQEQGYFASESEKMAQKAQSHMGEKQAVKQRHFKNKSLRQKKKHGVI